MEDDMKMKGKAPDSFEKGQTSARKMDSDKVDSAALGRERDVELGREQDAGQRKLKEPKEPKEHKHKAKGIGLDEQQLGGGRTDAQGWDKQKGLGKQHKYQGKQQTAGQGLDVSSGGGEFQGIEQQDWDEQAGAETQGWDEQAGTAFGHSTMTEGQQDVGQGLDEQSRGTQFGRQEQGQIRDYDEQDVGSQRKVKGQGLDEQSGGTQLGEGEIQDFDEQQGVGKQLKHKESKEHKHKEPKEHKQKESKDKHKESKEHKYKESKESKVKGKGLDEQSGGTQLGRQEQGQIRDYDGQDVGSQRKVKGQGLDEQSGGTQLGQEQGQIRDYDEQQQEREGGDIEQGTAKFQTEPLDRFKSLGLAAGESGDKQPFIGKQIPDIPVNKAQQDEGSTRH